MIERIVLLKLKDPAEREALVAAALRELPRVPGVVRARAGTPADAGAEVWDVVLVVTFARLEDVAAYVAHPIHEAFVAAELAPRVELRKVWNFAVTG